MREYQVETIPDLIGSLVEFAKQFSPAYYRVMCKDKHGKYEILAGFGAHRIIASEEQPFENLKRQFEENQVGCLTFEL